MLTVWTCLATQAGNTKCTPGTSFGKFGLSSLTKNLPNGIASPNFQKLANEGLGEYPQKAWKKTLLFWQIQFPKTCYDFGRYFAKYVSKTTLTWFCGFIFCLPHPWYTECISCMRPCKPVSKSMCDRSIKYQYSLQRWVSTKFSISQLLLFFIFL